MSFFSIFSLLSSNMRISIILTLISMAQAFMPHPHSFVHSRLGARMDDPNPESKLWGGSCWRIRFGLYLIHFLHKHITNELMLCMVRIYTYLHSCAMLDIHICLKKFKKGSGFSFVFPRHLQILLPTFITFKHTQNSFLTHIRPSIKSYHTYTSHIPTYPSSIPHLFTPPHPSPPTPLLSPISS